MGTPRGKKAALAGEPPVARGRFLDWRQVAVMCSCGSKVVSKFTVCEWTRVGVKVKGLNERIKLAAVELPKGRAWSKEGVDEFLEQLYQARAFARGEMKSVEAGPVRNDRHANPLKFVPRPAFVRCPAEMVGKYPVTRPGAAGRVAGSGGRGAGLVGGGRTGVMARAVGS